jgi:hypothetical protein
VAAAKKIGFVGSLLHGAIALGLMVCQLQPRRCGLRLALRRVEEMAKKNLRRVAIVSQLLGNHRESARQKIFLMALGSFGNKARIILSKSVHSFYG